MNARLSDRALATRLTRALPERVVYANSGGPMSRTREEQIDATLLGRDDGHIRCGHRLRLGLDFRDTNPLACMDRLLRAAGFRDPEELRACFVLPAETLIAHCQDQPYARMSINRCKPETILRQALLLGLCTDQLFDPRRPVLWTEVSLTRALDLYRPTGVLRMNERQFKSLLQEMIDRNAFAVRAMLRIVTVEFTESADLLPTAGTAQPWMMMRSVNAVAQARSCVPSDQ